jgi:hypothetical protein
MTMVRSLAAELQARLRTLGFEASAGGPDALRARIARELPMWGDIIKQAAIKPPQSRLVVVFGLCL